MNIKPGSIVTITEEGANKGKLVVIIALAHDKVRYRYFSGGKFYSGKYISTDKVELICSPAKGKVTDKTIISTYDLLNHAASLCK